MTMRLTATLSKTLDEVRSLYRILISRSEICMSTYEQELILLPRSIKISFESIIEAKFYSGFLGEEQLFAYMYVHMA
jgi:hypothetical protein